MNLNKYVEHEHNAYFYCHFRFLGTAHLFQTIPGLLAFPQTVSQFHVLNLEKNFRLHINLIENDIFSNQWIAIVISMLSVGIFEGSATDSFSKKEVPYKLLVSKSIHM